MQLGTHTPLPKKRVESDGLPDFCYHRSWCDDRGRRCVRRFGIQNGRHWGRGGAFLSLTSALSLLAKPLPP